MTLIQSLYNIKNTITDIIPRYIKYDSIIIDKNMSNINSNRGVVLLLITNTSRVNITINTKDNKIPEHHISNIITIPFIDTRTPSQELDINYIINKALARSILYEGLVESLKYITYHDIYTRINILESNYIPNIIFLYNSFDKLKEINNNIINLNKPTLLIFSNININNLVINANMAYTSPITTISKPTISKPTISKPTISNQPLIPYCNLIKISIILLIIIIIVIIYIFKE